MSHSRFIRAPGFIASALTVSFCAVAQAEHADTIFAAENALYGAGYNIGTADGWMDNTLRSAIRKYQSSHDGLQATGNLDPQTLSALGIANKGAATITGNTAPNRESAMAEMGISNQRFESTKTHRSVSAAAVPEPEVQPEPILVEEPIAKEEPVLAPDAAVAVVDNQSPQPEPELAEQAPKPAPQAVEKPESESAAIAASEEPLAAEPEPSVALNVPTEATEETSADVDFQLPEETTASDDQEISEPLQAANSSSSNASEPKAAAKSSGGFFSSLFDFLFGWLI